MSKLFGWLSEWKVLAIALIFVCPLSASAIGSVTDGDVTFAYTTNFNTSAGNTVNVDFTGAGTGDMAYESWWFFRVNGDIGETAFGTPDSESYTGPVGRLDWTDPGGAGLFTAALQFEVVDSGANIGNLFQNLRIANPTASDLVIDVFHYSDFDLGGSWNNDTAALTTNAAGIQIDVSDATETAPMIGYGADAYAVGQYSTLLQQLTNGTTTDLANTGLPFGTGDFTGAFQWSSVTVGAGNYTDFLTQFGSNGPLLDPTVTVIPEPNSAALAGFGLALLAWRGRRD